MTLEDLKYRRSWVKRYKTYTIEIKHEKRGDSHDEYRSQDNWWALYVYLYPEHPFFNVIKDPKDIWQPAVMDMPLHGGCTFISWYYSKGDGVPTCKEIGCDYHHYGDDFYEQEDNLERTGILHDVELLVDWLDKCVKE